jgi:hypothetical protein
MSMPSASSLKGCRDGVDGFRVKGQPQIMQALVLAVFDWRRFVRSCNGCFAWLVIGCMTGMTALPVSSQDRTLSDLLSGKTVPLKMQLKELGADWRRLTISSSGTVSGNISVNVSGNASANSQNNLTGAIGSSRAYVTKGETYSSHGHVYLVAYHLPGGVLDLSKLLQVIAVKAPPSDAALTLESVLPLSLLDLSSLGNLEDIRPFDAAAEIADSENALRALSELMKSQKGGGNADSSSKEKEDKEDKNDEEKPEK